MTTYSTQGVETRKHWNELVQETYPDQKPADYVDKPDGTVFFRLVGDAEGSRAGFFRAAWFPQHSYGYVEVVRA